MKEEPCGRICSHAVVPWKNNRNEQFFIVAVVVSATSPAGAEQERYEPSGSEAFDVASKIGGAVPRYGEAGEFVTTGTLGINLQTTNYDNSDASGVALAFAPSVDYFFIRDVSIGLEIDFNYYKKTGYDWEGELARTKYGLVGAGVRFGVNVPLGRNASFNPTAVFGFHRSEQSSASLDSAMDTDDAWRTTRTGPWMSVGAPFLLHLAPRFFLGFGPSWYRDFSRARGDPDEGSQVTSIGAGLLVGGFWGGQSTGRDAEPPPGPRRRFGDHNTVALTSELQLGGGWSSHSESVRESTSFAVAPSADWFFSSERVSAGVGFLGSYDRVVAFNAQQDVLTLEVTYLGPFVRVGLDLPFADRTSVYPSISLGYGIGQRVGDSETNHIEHTEHLLWTSLAFPVLVHVDHFFAGFGPSLTQDLFRSVDLGFEEVENRATSLGLGTFAGGWL